jgi:endonuclease/exonuclease/phosphatase family metal-dependent hydrolase
LSRTLSLLSWNCFGAATGLVSFLRWRGAADAHRFEHPVVRRALDAPDVVCMQEVFLGEAEDFFADLTHPHKARDSNAGTWVPLTVGGSGLAIASRHTLRRSILRPFSRPHVGSERFARKGALHVEVELEGGRAFDVVTTHMQSGYHDRAGTVRIRQLEELRALVLERGAPDRPFVISGDLNVCGLSQRRAHREYEALRLLFDDFDDLGASDDRPTFDPRPNENHLARRFEPRAAAQRIDYILFRGPRDAWMRPRGLRLDLVEPLPPLERSPPTHASDHYAVRVEFELAAPLTSAEAMLPSPVPSRDVRASTLGSSDIPRRRSRRAPRAARSPRPRPRCRDRGRRHTRTG